MLNLGLLSSDREKCLIEPLETMLRVLPWRGGSQWTVAEFAMFIPGLALSCMALMFLYIPVYFYVILSVLHGLYNSLCQLEDSEYVHSADCSCGDHGDWECALKYPCSHD